MANESISTTIAAIAEEWPDLTISYDEETESIDLGLISNPPVQLQPWGLGWRATLAEIKEKLVDSETLAEYIGRRAKLLRGLLDNEVLFRSCIAEMANDPEGHLELFGVVHRFHLKKLAPKLREELKNLAKSWTD